MSVTKTVVGLSPAAGVWIASMQLLATIKNFSGSPATAAFRFSVQTASGPYTSPVYADLGMGPGTIGSASTTIAPGASMLLIAQFLAQFPDGVSGGTFEFTSNPSGAIRVDHPALPLDWRLKTNASIELQLVARTGMASANWPTGESTGQVPIPLIDAT